MIRLPRYTQRDGLIYLIIMPLIVVVINLFVFDTAYFTNLKIFTLSTIVTLAIMSATWIALTWVAVVLRERFTSDKDMGKRMALSIFFFAIMTALTFTAIFYGYDYFNFLGYRLNGQRYKSVLAVGLVLNIFITFLHEGVSGFEKWKATLTETEQLKKEYMQSCLLGLKSQVNPHFLFNSLNSLSCLIQEDTPKAEEFLNEMSKVYRYLLRNKEEQLVSLNTELQFIKSYYYILQTRYGDGIELEINVNNEDKQANIPPLTIQVLIENTINLNRISKEHPLKVIISSLNDGWLQVKNNIHEKIVEDREQYEAGVENIVNKFRLLCQQNVRINNAEGCRIIELPLIRNKECA